MRLLEEKTEADEAQNYKLRYEEKQRKELCTEDHKILFFMNYFLQKLNINIIYQIANIGKLEKKEKY